MADIAAGRCSVYVVLVALLFGCISHRTESFRYGATYEGDSEVHEGLPFRITCKITKRDFPKWTINGIEIPEDNDWGYTLDSQEMGTIDIQMTLSTSSAQLRHDGEYRCNAYSRDFHFLEVIENGDDEEQEADDDAADDDDEDDDFGEEELAPPSEFVLHVNETIILDCIPAEDDDTDIKWYKNDKQIIVPHNSNIHFSGRSLIIEDAQEEDAGQYMCIMDYVHGTGFTSIGRILKVKSPARIVDFPVKMSAMKKRDMTLHCRVTGFPFPNITWFIGNELVETDSRIWIYTKGQKQSLLTIRDLSLSDRGLYTCRANNSIDGKTSEHDEMSVFIHVRENMIETNEDVPGVGKLLVPGQQLVLYCNTTECSHCRVLWYKDGQNLTDVDNHIKIFDNNSVVISEASYNDSGIYVCAIDRVQLDVALNASISVQSEIILEKFESSSAVVVEGSPLELHCIAKGAPPPQIRWFRGSEEIKSHPRIKLYEHNGLKNARLLIEEAEFEDRNHYTCEAYNELNSANITIFIRIKDKLAALWPFLGICVEVAILCSIIFVYERRKSKAQFDEPDTDHPTENKHPKDQKAKGQDVRQRK